MSDKQIVQQADDTTLGKALWRFLTGQHLDGWERMNTSWTRRGTEPMHRDNWWNRKARLERAVWRDGLLSLFIFGWWGYVVHPIITLSCLSALTLYELLRVVGHLHKRFRVPLKIGYGDTVWYEHVWHHRHAARWQNIKAKLRRTEPIPAEEMPVTVKKNMQAVNEVEGGLPIISAELSPPIKKLVK